jgi:hypothetical protein
MYRKASNLGEKGKDRFAGGRAGMTSRQRNGNYYQEKAREIARFASRARSATVRLELLDIADRFDRMAAYVERRINPGEDGEEDLDRAAAP